MQSNLVLRQRKNRAS